FWDDTDRKSFLTTLEALCVKTNWQVHAYCLMSNHFHLVVETPRANLVGGMKWLLGTYTMRFNRRHRLSGHLFAGRYKSLVVDGSRADYLRAVCDYVHLNPARAGLVTREEELASYRWSSYGAYLQPGLRPTWLRCDRLLGEHGVARGGRRDLLEFARRMEARRDEESDPAAERIRRGWHFGTEDFVARLLDQLEGKMGPEHEARERSETEEEKAERLVRVGLAEIDWSDEDLETRRKGASEKVVIAARVRAETAVSLKWIAARLRMGTWTHVSNLLGSKNVSSED
ncbi:MAG: transposase, partial [Chthoniobacterales bacterium]